MFTNFHIERFRGIPALDIDGVKPITLLVGKNNSGKTNVLEAIFLLCGATNPYTPTLIGQLRGQRIATAQDADTTWRSLFHGMTSKQPSVVEGTRKGEGVRHLEFTTEYSSYSVAANGQTNGVGEVGAVGRSTGLVLRYTSWALPAPVITNAAFDPQGREILSVGETRPDFLPVTFLPSRLPFHLWRDTELYSNLVRLRREKGVIDVLRLIDPRLRGLAVISEGREATVYADLGDDALIPLSVCGEGMLRLLSVALDITHVTNGIYLIDEIDNGLHHSVMKELWPVLRKLCAEHNVQLIATTHNDEILRYAIKAFEDVPETFGVFRLDRVGEGMKAVGYHGEVLSAVNEMPWEIRG